MSEINALRNWAVCRGCLDSQEKNQSSEAGVLVVICGRSQRQTLHNPALLQILTCSEKAQQWCPPAARHKLYTSDTQHGLSRATFAGVL